MAEAREMGRIGGRCIGMGETNNCMSKRKMGREEGDELRAEAREMRRFEGRLIGMGETKMVPYHVKTDKRIV